MRRIIVRTLGALIAIGGAASAFGQAWDFECIDPGTATPYSTDFAVTTTRVQSTLINVFMGVSGTVTYGDAGTPNPPGDDNIPCFAETHNIAVAGRFGYAFGSDGSIQDQHPSDPNALSFIDDFMPVTPGAPISPGGSGNYVNTIEDTTSTRFGSNGIGLLFSGLSNRYIRCQSQNGNIRIDLTISVVGDAIQFHWVMTNTDAASHNIGLWVGNSFAMITAGADRNGASISGFPYSAPTNSFAGIKDGYVVLSTGGRPPVTEHRYRRAINPNGFPQYADFLFGQTSGFGIRLENGPTEATKDQNGNSDAEIADEFVLGQQFFLLGRIYDDSNFPDVIFPPIDPNDPDLGSDVGYLDEPACIQKFTPRPVAAGSTRTLNYYVRSSWGVSNYSAPYAAVVDAPKLLAEDSSGDVEAQNGLRPNPMTIRVYLDNVGGYATINQEIDLSSVRVTLGHIDPTTNNFVNTLSDGFALAPGETISKTIPSVPARAVRFVDFQVAADGVAFGDIPYSVKIEPVPGPTKILSGSIRVASTPRLVLHQDANLVTTPWIFGDTSWESILSPLTTPTDFQAFAWDTQQQGYVISTSAERGKAVWIISSSDQGSIPLGGNPQSPPDTAAGGKVIQLHGGWNLIGNPYNYAIQVGELVGVSAAAPSQSYPWAQLVNQGLVSGALVYYDTDLQDYVFTGGNDAPIMPNRGYWCYVATQQDLTLSFPAVFQPFLPGSTRANKTPSRWVQSDKQWRLKLAARTNKSLDAENYVGKAKDLKTAKELRYVEPPLSPVQKVELAISETVDGAPTRLAQSLSEKTGRKEWKVVVTATEAGTVSLTWPNMTTTPKNMKFRLTDTSTGTTRDMRKVSGYSFEAAANSTREFKVEATPGGVTGVVIGSVVVNKAGRANDPTSPFAINYTLSNDATTSIRILSGSGKEVYTISRGRADKAGENSATWALRDNANRSVAPGTYRVEILAETSTGERVRRVVPINVIR